MFMLKSTHRAAMAAKNDRIEDAVSRLYSEKERANRIAGRLAGATLDREKAYAALCDIADMETEHCAHIGKRMAGRAREALPWAPVLKAVG